jgi:hypothetical protein
VRMFHVYFICTHALICHNPKPMIVFELVSSFSNALSL